MSHEISYRVYYEDTDAGGVVYHANYLRFSERARTECLREMGFNQSTLDVVFVVKKIDIEYLFPARLDDVLTVKTTVTNLSRASFTLEQDFFVGKKPVAKSSVVIVCVSRNEIRPVALPPDIRAKFEEINK